MSISSDFLFFSDVANFGMPIWDLKSVFTGRQHSSLLGLCGYGNLGYSTRPVPVAHYGYTLVPVPAGTGMPYFTRALQLPDDLRAGLFNVQCFNSTGHTKLNLMLTT